VTVSYFEWTQNRQGLYWKLDNVHQRLHEIMVRSFDEVHGLMEQSKTDMRTAAYAVALNRIGDAIEAGGTERFFQQ